MRFTQPVRTEQYWQTSNLLQQFIRIAFLLYVLGEQSKLACYASRSVSSQEHTNRASVLDCVCSTRLVDWTSFNASLSQPA